MKRYRCTFSFIGSTAQFVFEVNAESIGYVQEYALPEAYRRWKAYVLDKGLNIDHATIKTMWFDRLDHLEVTRKSVMN